MEKQTATARALATGGRLEIYASKTLEEARALTAQKPSAIIFPTDADCIVFNGREYGAAIRVVDAYALRTGMGAAEVEACVGKPYPMMQDVLDGRAFVSAPGAYVSHPLSVTLNSGEIALTWLGDGGAGRVRVCRAALKTAGGEWTGCTVENLYLTPSA